MKKFNHRKKLIFAASILIIFFILPLFHSSYNNINSNINNTTNAKKAPNNINNNQNNENHILPNSSTNYISTGYSATRTINAGTKVTDFSVSNLQGSPSYDQVKFATTTTSVEASMNSYVFTGSRFTTTALSTLQATLESYDSHYYDIEGSWTGTYSYGVTYGQAAATYSGEPLVSISFTFAVYFDNNEPLKVWYNNTGNTLLSVASPTPDQYYTDTINIPSSNSLFDTIKNDQYPAFYLSEPSSQLYMDEFRLDYHYYSTENLNVKYHFNLAGTADFTDLQSYKVFWTGSCTPTTALAIYDENIGTTSNVASAASGSSLSETIDASSYIQGTNTAPVLDLTFTSSSSSFSQVDSFTISDVYFQFYEDDSPVLTITSPASGAYCDSTPNVQVTATDGNGISSVNVTSDGLSDTNMDGGSGNYYLDYTCTDFDNWFNDAGTSQGSHTLNITAYDACGNPTSDTVDFIKDTINPSLQINYNDNYTNNDPPIINCSASDTNLDQVYATYLSNDYTLINDSGYYILNGSCSDGSGNFADAWSGMAEQGINIIVTALDSAGNTNSSTLTIVKDLTLPVAFPTNYINSTGVSPLTNTTSFGNNSLPMFYSIIQDSYLNESACFINLYSDGVNQTFNLVYDPTYNDYGYSIGPSTPNFNSTWDACSGSTNITVFETDLAGNYNFTEYDTYIDRNFPSISIDAPTEGQFFNNTPEFDVSTYDHDGIASISYNVSDSEYPTTGWSVPDTGDPINGTNTFSIDSDYWGLLAHGTHTISIKVTDINGNSNVTSVTIEKDTYPPVFENFIHYSETFQYDFNITELSLNASSVRILYTNGTYLQNATLFNQSGETYEFKGDLDVLGPDGNYSFIINYADLIVPPSSYNNSIWLMIDTVNPIISYYNITNMTSFYSPPTLNLTIQDANPDFCNITFAGQAYPTYDITGTQQILFSIEPIQWLGLSDGHYSIDILIEDKEGHISQYQIIIVKDMTPPNITIETNMADNGTTFYNYQPILSLNGSEEFSVTYYVSIYSDFSINYTLSEDANSHYTIPADLWNNLQYGSNTLYIMGVDKAGNYEIITLDCQKIASFQNLVSYSDTFSYNFNISEYALNTTNVMILYSNGTFIQDAQLYSQNGIEYEFKGDLNVVNIDENYSFIINYTVMVDPSVSFNDSIWLIVDRVDPIVSYFSIDNETSYIDPPTLDLTIQDVNPDFVNITFANTTKPYDISGTQQIEFSVDYFTWSDLPDGHYTISVLVQDKAGHATQYEIIVVKDTTPPNITIETNMAGNSTVFYNYQPVLSLDGSEEFNVTYYVSTYGDFSVNYTLTEDVNSHYTIPADLWNNLQYGSNTLYIMGVDKAGNYEIVQLNCQKEASFQGNVNYSDNFCYDFNITEYSLNTSNVMIFYENGTFIQNANLSSQTGIEYEFKGSLNVTQLDGNYTFIINYTVMVNPPVTFTDSVWLIVDRVNPIVSYENIVNETSYINSPTLNLTIQDINPDFVNCSFVNQSEIFDISQNQNVTFSLNSTLWQGLSDGHYTISILVQDKAGHFTEYEIIVVKDTTAPNITIITNMPDNSTIFNETTPILSLNGSEEFSVTYYISAYDNFSVNYTLTLNNNSQYVIPSDLWNSLQYSNDTLYIMGVDKAGNYEIVQFDCQKWDTIDPVMDITAPSSYGEIAPLITIEIMDDNLQFVYYYVGDTRVDVDLSSITITSDTTVNFYIDQSLWDQADSQTFNITVFSVDKFGNTSNRTISITRTDYIPPLGASTHKQRGDDLTLGLFLNMQWQVIVILSVIFVFTFYITHKMIKKSNNSSVTTEGTQ